MEELTLLMSWPALVSPDWVRGLGAIEIALAVLSLAPLISWRWGRPVLLAATLALQTMALGFLILHAFQGEIGHTVVNTLLVLMTAAVFHGRRYWTPSDT